MRLENLLFRHGGGYYYVDELSAATRERLLARARSLNQEERRCNSCSGCPTPRLCLIYEETASLITAGELRRLRAEIEGGADGGS